MMSAPVKNAHTFPEVVTASRVSSMPRTVHGCRPTSVPPQPASRHTTASTPETAVARRNQLGAGKIPAPPPHDREPHAQRQQREADADHDLERPVDDVDETC